MSGLFVENSCEILRTYFSNLGIRCFPGGKRRKRETGRKLRDYQKLSFFRNQLFFALLRLGREGLIFRLLRHFRCSNKTPTLTDEVCITSPGDPYLGEQITQASSLRNTEWATHNCVLGYPVIGKLQFSISSMMSIP